MVDARDSESVELFVNTKKWLVGIGGRMKTLMYLTKMWVGDVSVDLSSGNVGMAEEGLDGTKIGAVHDEIGGKRMTKSVGGDMFGDAGNAGVFFDETLN